MKKIVKYTEPSSWQRALGRIADWVQKARKAMLTLSVTATCAILTATPAFATDTDGTGSTGGVGAGSDIWAWLDYALGVHHSGLCSGQRVPDPDEFFHGRPGGGKFPGLA